jgi:periplasmic protein TonB
MVWPTMCNHLKLFAMKKYIQAFQSAIDLFKMAKASEHNTESALQVIFSGRNQAYGAYQLRKNYNETVGKSLFFSISGIVGFFLLAGLSFGAEDQIVPEERYQPEVKVVKEIKIIPEELLALKAAGSKRKTIIFVPPVVVPDNKPVAEVKKPTVAEVQATTSEVGTITSTTGTETGVSGAAGTTQTGTDVEPEPEPVKPVLGAIEDFAEIPAEFEGGEAALLAFLQKNIKYPAMAIENHIQGRVYVQFIVELGGTVSQIKVMKDIGGGCGAEAMRVARKMPLWKPAKQNGKQVRTRFTMPVLFKLQG